MHRRRQGLAGEPGEERVGPPLVEGGDGFVQHLTVAQVRERLGGIADRPVLRLERRECRADQAEQAAQLLAAAAGLVDDAAAGLRRRAEIRQRLVELVKRNRAKGRVHRLAMRIELVHRLQLCPREPSRNRCHNPPEPEKPLSSAC
jgi:hypothetical protein